MSRCTHAENKVERNSRIAQANPFSVCLLYSGQWQPLVGGLRERVLRGRRHPHPPCLLGRRTEEILWVSLIIWSHLHFVQSAAMRIRFAQKHFKMYYTYWNQIETQLSYIRKQIFYFWPICKLLFLINKKEIDIFWCNYIQSKNLSLRIT